MPGSKISNAPEIEFCSCFMHLELMRKGKEDDVKVGESKVRPGL